jgi:hypothetical protein
MNIDFAFDARTIYSYLQEHGGPEASRLSVLFFASMLSREQRLKPKTNFIVAAIIFILVAVFGSFLDLSTHAPTSLGKWRPFPSDASGPPSDELQGKQDYHSTSAVPPSALANAVDQILDSLPSGTIAFNAPPAMTLADTAVIQLNLGLATPIDVLKRMIEA